MSATVTINPTTVTLTPAQSIIATATNEVTMVMVKALMEAIPQGMEAIPQGLDFKGIAEKHTILKLEELVEASDQKTQVVYNTLFRATHEHIQTNSPPLKMTLAQISLQTGRADAPGEFLGSFVWQKMPEVMNLLLKLASKTI